MYNIQSCTYYVVYIIRTFIHTYMYTKYIFTYERLLDIHIMHVRRVKRKHCL